MKKYKARENSKFSQNDAQKIGRFLEKVFKNKEIKTKQLVALAEEKDSPIHNYFEWNDTKAAYQYRLDQARDMVQAIYIEIEGKEVRAYENVYIKEINSRAYKKIDSILNAPDLSKQIIEKAMEEVKFWNLKYQNYTELSGIFNAISLTERKFNGTKKSNS